MVSDIISKNNVLNTETNAVSISKHTEARKKTTSSKWGINTVTGAKI